MNLFCLYYQFKFSMANTTYALLEIGVGTACLLCYRCGSRVVPHILQGVSAMPTYEVLGLAI